MYDCYEMYDRDYINRMKQADIEDEYSRYEDVFGNVKTLSRPSGLQYWGDRAYITEIDAKVSFNQEDILFNDTIFCQNFRVSDYYTSTTNREIYFKYNDLLYYVWFSTGSYQIKEPYKLETFCHIYAYDISQIENKDISMHSYCDMINENKLNKVFDSGLHIFIDENTNIIYETIKEVSKKHKKRTKK